MEGVYLLPRDTTESERLTTQHRLASQILGWIIHPTIPTPLTTPSLGIADIATGTGIFLSDVAEQTPPSTQLHGFDISDAQLPPLDKRPQNLHFHVHDIREGFAEEFRGTFDVIDIRLILLGLKGKDWDKAVKNVAKLLKPGGYIQWVEPDHSHTKILHNKSGAPAAAAKEINRLVAAWIQENMIPNPLRLPELFKENGLEVLADEICATDRLKHLSLYPTSVGKMILEIQVTEGKMEREREKADELLKTALAETKDGDIYQHSDVCVYVGRKPL